MAHEQLSAPRSRIDQDFADLESFEGEERLLFIKDIFRQLNEKSVEGITRHRSELSPMTYTGAVELTQYDPDSLPVDPSMRAEFVLPEIPSPMIDDRRSFDSLREMPKFQKEFYMTDEHLLLSVAQGYMYRIPKTMNPYLYLSMSECSAVVAHSDTCVFVAHVSFSLASETDAVMDRLKVEGVDDSQIRIIANVMAGENDYRSMWPDESKRLMSVDDYRQRYGEIPADNILPFTHTFTHDDNPSLRPITEVVVDNHGLLAMQADFDHKTHRFKDELPWQEYRPA